jgi:hypothetical protein
MTVLAFFGHLANFVVPALAVAALLAAAARLRPGGRRGRHGFWRHVACSSLVGTAVLLVGLWWSGRDGKMATYAALVLAQGTIAWWFHRDGGTRRGAT